VDADNLLDGLAGDIRAASGYPADEAEWQKIRARWERGERALGRVIKQPTWVLLEKHASDRGRPYWWYGFYRRCRYCPACGLPYVYRTEGHRTIGRGSAGGVSIKRRRICNACRERRAPILKERAAKRLIRRLSALRLATAEKLKKHARTQCAKCGAPMVSKRTARAYCTVRCRVAAFRAQFP
jgi:endogenous inhibitor of DNA gyrase (YacG/DUF329 family)